MGEQALMELYGIGAGPHPLTDGCREIDKSSWSAGRRWGITWPSPKIIPSRRSRPYRRRGDPPTVGVCRVRAASEDAALH